MKDFISVMKRWVLYIFLFFAAISSISAKDPKGFFDDIEQLPFTEPNFTEDARDFLHKHIEKNPRIEIFQFGSGISTLWLAQRCRSISCVEHDLYSYKQLLVTLKSHLLQEHVKCRFKTRPYASICDRFEDEKFDLVIVEGLDRMRSLQKAIRILKKGGILVLNDAQRKHYSHVEKYVKGWKAYKTYQKKPDPIYHDADRHTYWWIKPE